MNIDLLTAGELKELLKDVPDNVECVIVQNRWDEHEQDFADATQSPIHKVKNIDYQNQQLGDSQGLLKFVTCYTRTGQLGLDDYL